jgi:hypothetical protein
MDLEWPDFEPAEPRQPSRLETLAFLVTAAATLVAVLKGARPLIQILLSATALLIAIFLWHSSLSSAVREWRLRRRRTRKARAARPEFLRLEQRLSEFLSERDYRNLRHIINDIGGCNNEELFKICPPDYLNVFSPFLFRRHSWTKHAGGTKFLIAVNELVAMTASYNDDYVLQPLKRLKTSPRFTGLEPNARKYKEETIEAFRERWVKFLDDVTEFVAARKIDSAYNHDELAVPHFTRPNKLT